MIPVRAAVIGSGNAGRLHARALHSLPAADLVAVCSRDEDRAQQFGAEFGARGYTDVQEMVEQARVEMVVVCTPHPAHAAPTCLAARSGAHVLVEKPMAVSLADCDVMIEAAEDAGVTLGVTSQRRFYEPVQRVKAAIDSGKIGWPVLGEVLVFGWRGRDYYQSDEWRGTWEHEGGGVLVNQAVHQLDLLLWFMGEVSEVSGYWANFNHPYIEVDDTAVAAVRFASGGLGTITVSNSQKPGLYGKVHIHGHNGASIGVQTDGGSMFIAGMSEIEEPPYNDLWTVPGEADDLEGWKKNDCNHFATIDPVLYYHRLQDQDFLQAIREGRPPLVTATEGRQLVELFTAVYRSEREKRSIAFPLRSEAAADYLDG